jgi:hypothetical protein
VEKWVLQILLRKQNSAGTPDIVNVLRIIEMTASGTFLCSLCKIEALIAHLFGFKRWLELQEIRRKLVEPLFG